MITAKIINDLLPKADALAVAKISYYYDSTAKKDLDDSIYRWFKTLVEKSQYDDTEDFNNTLKHGLWIGSIEGKYDLDTDMTGYLIKAREWDKYNKSLSRCPYSSFKSAIRAVKIVRSTGCYRPTLAQLKEAEKRYIAENIAK